MITAVVSRRELPIMERTYHDPNLSLEMVIKQMEMYIINEQLNTMGECIIKVRYEQLQAS